MAFLLQYYSYTFPLAQPLKTSGITIYEREGLIARWMNGDYIFYSEAAPLPGFSLESLPEIKNELEHKKQNFIRSLSQENDHYLKDLTGSASLRFMFDSLRYKKMRVGKNLISDNKLQPVSINTVLPIQNQQDALKHCQIKYQQGYRTFKIKISAHPDQEIALLHELRKQFPDIHIRLDANGAWNTESAISILSDCRKCNIEYCEQPTPAGQEHDFREIEQKSGVHIAADESIRSVEDCHKIISQKLCSVVILKPMLIGTFSDIKQICTLCHKHNITVVFTTALESAIGRTLTAHLAAAYGSNVAHGLDTGHFLQNDFDDDSRLITKGYYHPDNSSLYKTYHLNGIPGVTPIL